MDKRIFTDWKNMSEEEIRATNKELIKKYPYLLPRNVWTDKVVEDYDYSWTHLDDFPTGWRIAFSEMFLDELNHVLDFYGPEKKYDLRIYQIKEKYGSFRFYTNWLNEWADNVVEKYSALSENICVICGKPDVPSIDDGWICPYCEPCWRRNTWSHHEYEEFITDKHNDTMMNEVSFIRWDQNGKSIHRIPCGDTARKIRENYKKRMEEQNNAEKTQ